MIAVSGGMVASFALPASADPVTPRIKAKARTTNALALAAPSAAQGPLVPAAFGTIGFSGIDKPKPKPVVRVESEAPSRSAERVPAPSSAGVLGIAASLAGIYYIYGGTTPAGFDCSGYTQYVFAKVGIKLPRTAEQQRQVTTPVTNPQPGDLVFFGAPAHHMGIYAGNGKMWDSEQTGVAVMLHTDRSERDGGATYGRL